MSTATASVAVRTLIDRGLVERRPGNDRRSILIALSSEGQRLADQIGQRPPALSAAVDALGSEEQAAMLVSLIKIVRELQLTNQIPRQRMCVTCTYFRPQAHPGTPEPHHCAFVDAAFADRHLRLDCGEQQEADPDAQSQTWARFVDDAVAS